ncbi:Transcriptional regulatory protein moc3-like protein 12 [Colletotrichum chlorophyti]|uniref:Transcriptional regulatory protein moc3-like protein 12 n=1 Tax=Colletotrichum chlorophyti TaxID=708187 RepID=A0A1Q8R9F1_9PEZI|nr:Transcriptional regulatory protein moc3-like protein 12 [Colletotrichum chlorophyti]
MPRSGTSRVKTGCTTCKIRRVKCDEARPFCTRCLSTGRKCDGYVAPPTINYSWAQLLRACPPQNVHSAIAQPNIDGAAAAAERAMNFYQRVAGPAFAGSLNKYFWNSVVLQVSNQEPVASHAVLALSSLYESYCKGEEKKRGNSFAVWHYNHAIKLLRTTTDRALILFVCVLFICIELLRNNHQDAIAHCRHGINILNEVHTESDFLRNHVTPAIRYLSIVPYHYGADPNSFPILGKPLPSSTSQISSASEGHARFVSLHLRMTRYLANCLESRLRCGHAGPDPDAKWTREFIIVDLETWHMSLQALKARENLGEKDRDVLRLLEIRYIASKLNMETSVSDSELVYDKHLDKFRAILMLASQAAANNAQTFPDKTSQWGSECALELGFSPLMYPVVTKCRILKLRLEALRLMKKLLRPQCNIWEKSVTYLVARRVVEIEHGIHLGGDDFGVPEGDGELPPEENRVVDVDFGMRDIQSRRPYEKKVRIVMKQADGKGYSVRDEWLPLPCK